jgi:hypothetical protein
VRAAADEIRSGAPAEPAEATVAAGEAGTPDSGLPKEQVPDDVIPVPAP